MSVMSVGSAAAGTDAEILFNRQWAASVELSAVAAGKVAAAADKGEKAPEGWLPMPMDCAHHQRFALSWQGLLDAHGRPMSWPACG